LRTRWREQKKMDHAAMSVVGEVFAALRVVKAFNQEEREQNRYANRANESLIAKLKVTVLQGSFDIVAALLTSICTALVLYIGVDAIRSGAMTVGDLLIVMTYVGLLYEPLRMIGRRVASMQSALASAERAFDLIDECPDVPEKAAALTLKRAGGAIEFKDVSFAYSKSTPILHDINLQIPAGTRVGVVGKTGGGKTTLMSLLMRFYDPTKGEVFLDGIDLTDYNLKDLRNQYAMVLQDTILFSTTIHENIAYARHDASEQQIIDAAKAAHAHEFISQLPDGYETVVGERGMRLSGGERQRVALARAFLKDAPILLFDEPTSAVDTRTEAAIMEVMNKLMVGRTTFMIAHRLSTLDRCDVILHLENGRLVDIKNTEPKPQQIDEFTAGVGH
jgi:ATP-binding cassette subfamily B protein